MGRKIYRILKQRDSLYMIYIYALEICIKIQREKKMLLHRATNFIRFTSSSFFFFFCTKRDNETEF